MKTEITYDRMNNTLIITKAFEKRANNYGSNEYYLLRKAMEENPNSRIVYKSAKKKTYKALSYEAMEEYIKISTNSEEAVLRFKAVKKVAAAKGTAYPATKKWFLATYPEYKDIQMEKEAIDTQIAELKKELAKMEEEKAASAANLRVATETLNEDSKNTNEAA